MEHKIELLEQHNKAEFWEVTIDGIQVAFGSKRGCEEIVKELLEDEKKTNIIYNMFKEEDRVII